MIKNDRNILIGSAFIAGFALMVIELIATRIMAPYVGSSIYTWTSVIGVVLFGMAIGNYGGGIYADKYGSRKELSLLFAITSIVTFLIPLGAYFSPVVALLGLPISITTLLLALVLFFVPAVLFGTLYPSILKLHLKTTETTGIKSGQISATWSLGSIVGTFLAGFYFIGYVGSSATILLIAIVLLINAAILYTSKKRLAWIAVLFLCVGVVTYVMHLFTDVRGKVFAAESEYYKIQVVDSSTEKNGKVRTLFLDADSHSVEGLEGQKLNLYPDIYPIFSAMGSSMKDVLVIGGGSYTLSKKIVSAYKDANVTTVEIDPKVQQVAEDYFKLREYPMQTEVADGRVFLQRTDKKYDLIFSDAYNSFVSVPWHMTTREFNEEVKNHLNENGLYAVNFISARAGENAGLFESIGKTFRETFSQYVMFAYGESEYAPQNIVLVGVNTNNAINIQEIREKIARGENGEFLSKLLIDDSIVASKGVLLKDNHAPVERLMMPLMNNYFNQYIPTYYSTMTGQGE
ncbi:MAG: Spermine synthase [uncultured bacterium]|uniref:Spermine synthase n=1 Tax=Candidatus Wolfebacteria bacterium GW2011_GWE2_44_13 TaxID=1619017 RepID=A0A0G1H6A6_9BACT|nr:MAG: Spermine synthase [uncultured bacterium]KKT42916.1 MAG: Spermine synthase [Candidatus Wolfebacteria bacterium GW2011_GWE2_44_13]